MTHRIQRASLIEDILCAAIMLGICAMLVLTPHISETVAQTQGPAAESTAPSLTATDSSSENVSHTTLVSDHNP